VIIDEALAKIDSELSAIRVELKATRENLQQVDARQAALARAGANQSLQMERALPRIADDLGHVHGALLLIDGTASRIERAVNEFKDSIAMAMATIEIKGQADGKKTAEKTVEAAQATVAAAIDAKAAAEASLALAKTQAAQEGILSDGKHLTARFAWDDVKAVAKKVYPLILAGLTWVLGYLVHQAKSQP
jgi:hypothetical protein